MIAPQYRFQILRRDSFACAYCGARPGNDRLNVDHLVPRSIGGTDHDWNLAASCDKCNNGKSSRLAIPASLCDGEVDKDGWIVWKRWGPWTLKWNPKGDSDTCLVLSTHPDGGRFEYWIGMDQFHEQDWERHIRQKEWINPDAFGFFCEAMSFARTITRPTP